MPKNLEYRVGSRHSDLAMVQTQWAVQSFPLPVRIVQITTTADAVQDRPLKELGGKGMFCRELEQALLQDQVDCVIHSAKDVPTVQTPGTAIIGCVWQRGDRRDAILTGHDHLLSVPSYTNIGTSSARRQVQLQMLRPDCTVKLLRGNIGTRIRRLADGEFSAIVMAECAVQRLNVLDSVNTINHPTWRGQHHVLSVDDMLPAAGAGCVVVQIRQDDKRSWDLWNPLLLPEPTLEMWCERAVLQGIQGDCDTAAGVMAEVKGQQMQLRAGWWDEGAWWTARDEGAVEQWQQLADSVVRTLWQHRAQTPK